MSITVRLQEVADRWPADFTKEHRDIRFHWQRRVRELIANNASPAQLEKEAACLERLILNRHRDSYSVPDGLGGSPPRVGATGLDIASVSTILANKGTAKPKKGLFARLLQILN